MASDHRTPKRKQAASGVDATLAARSASAAKKNKMRLAAEQQIDKFMKKVGYTNLAERTDEQGRRWNEIGTARGRAAVVESESDGE